VVVTTPQVNPVTTVSVLMPLILPGELLGGADQVTETAGQPEASEPTTNDTADSPASIQSNRHTGSTYPTTRTYRNRRFRR